MRLKSPVRKAYRARDQPLDDDSLPITAPPEKPSPGANPVPRLIPFAIVTALSGPQCHHLYTGGPARSSPQDAAVGPELHEEWTLSGSAQAERTQKPAMALGPAGWGPGLRWGVLPTSTSHSYSEASSRVTRQMVLLYFLAIFWGDFWALLGVVLSDRPSASP